MNIDDLLKNKPLLFDGGMGTELQKKGLQPGSPPEIFFVEKPETIKAVHSAYVAAGSRIIETCSFGGNRKRLEFSGIDDKFLEVNRLAAKMAFEAAGKSVLVAGSIGPLGVTIEPFGELPSIEAKDIFSEQIRILKDEGVKIFLIETMISLDEALIALEAAKELNADVVGVTVTFDFSSGGARTAYGESVAQVCDALTTAGADFIGSNCGQGFSQMLKIAVELRSSSSLPLLVQPNAGLPEVESGQTLYRETPDQFADFVKKAKSIGIEMVGGCCGTTPAHIGSAAKVLYNS